MNYDKLKSEIIDAVSSLIDSKITEAKLLADGWIKYETCANFPVENHDMVEVRFRSGASSIGKVGTFSWVIDGDDGDILFFRKVEQPAPEPVKPWPQEGDTYFVAKENGIVKELLFSSYRYDIGALSVGNVLKTKAQAERRLEAMKVLTELRNCDGVVPIEVPWERDLYGIFWHPAENEEGFYVASCGNFQLPIGGVHFSSNADAKAARKKIGQKRLRVYLDDFLNLPMEGE